MGLRSPFGYVGYEPDFLDCFIYLLENFCGSCHDNKRDYDGDCHKCPVGQLVYASKEYLLDAIESDICKENTRIIRKIKEEIKHIEPSPLLLCQLRWVKPRQPNPLLKLKELNDDLKWEKTSDMSTFYQHTKIEEQIANLLKHKYKQNGKHKRDHHGKGRMYRDNSKPKTGKTQVGTAKIH